MGKVIRDAEELARRIRLFRQQGKTVVLANGCFDLLHVGHVRALRDASTRGHYLVVALNSDRSVAALKGKGQPVQPEGERAEIVAALDGVDYVTIFEEETVDALLERLRPSALAKGPEYTWKNLPEAATLKSIGGELCRVGDPKDHSTRDLISRIRAGRAAPVTRSAGRKKASKKKTSTKKAATKAAGKKKTAKKAAKKTASKGKAGKKKAAARKAPAKKAAGKAKGRATTRSGGAARRKAAAGR